MSLYLGGEKGKRWTETAGQGWWEWFRQVCRQHHWRCHRDDQVGGGCSAWDHVAIKQIEWQTVQIVPGMIFFWSKIAIYLSLDLPQRTAKLQEKPSALKRQHSTLQKKNETFFLFLLVNIALLYNNAASVFCVRWDFDLTVPVCVPSIFSPPRK